MQHRHWSGLFLSVHFHLPHAKTNTLTWNQAYSFIELFCGEAWVSKVMRAGGHCTASLDIRLGEALPGKQNAYDLLDPGFAFLWLQVSGMAQCCLSSFTPKSLHNIFWVVIDFNLADQLPQT